MNVSFNHSQLHAFANTTLRYGQSIDDQKGYDRAPFFADQYEMAHQSIEADATLRQATAKFNEAIMHVRNGGGYESMNWLASKYASYFSTVAALTAPALQGNPS